jgi:4'-phosphopantetheinyl transferase EntD
MQKAMQVSDNADLVSGVRQAYCAMAATGIFVVAGRIGEVDDLMEPEQGLVARAVTARRAEFAAGRWCARRALALAGGPRVAILKGPHHEPIWPRGFSGSLSHDGRLAAAAAYRLPPNGRPIIGIDLLDRPDPARFLSVAAVVLSHRDRLALAGRERDGFEVAKAFSAKEAAIKILSSYAARFIEFTEITIRRTPSGFVLSHPEFNITICSRYRLVDDVLLTLARISSDPAD